jgi:hypothetical protein
MDPATALGLACTVWSLLEIGTKIGKQIREAHQTGSLSACDEVRNWSNSISIDNVEIDKKLNPSSPSANPASPLDQQIQKLVDRTIQEAKNLNLIIDEIAGSSAPGTASKWPTRVAFALNTTSRAMRKKGKLKDVEQKLRRCKDDMEGA